MSRLALPVRFVGAALLSFTLAACGPRDPNATAIPMFPTRVPIQQLPTSGGGGGVIQTPLPTNLPPPTLNIPTLPNVTQIPPTRLPPTPVPTIDANWNQIVAGVVWRNISFRAPSTGQGVTVTVVRFDPQFVRFKVFYFQGQVRTIYQWQQALPGALAVMNASFFTPQNQPLGLVAMDNVLLGASLARNDSGLFQVKAGTPRVRSLYLEPYNNTESFEQVVQGLPVLMVNGMVAPAFNPDINTAPAKRSVVAMDSRGRVLFIVTQPGLSPQNDVSLLDMARFLGAAGLEVFTAVNLDGGSSSALYMATGGPSQFIPGVRAFPVAIAVFRR